MLAPKNRRQTSLFFSIHIVVFDTLHYWWGGVDKVDVENVKIIICFKVIAIEFNHLRINHSMEYCIFLKHFN